MHPTIRLLGPVQVQHAPGPPPPGPGRTTELVAFLALHPWHSYELLDDALWPGQRVTATTRNRAMNQARTWLGTDPTGRPWVNLVAEAGYALAPTADVDWWAFRALITPQPALASTAQLHQALQLVTGQPLSGVPAHRYIWAETDRAEMIELVADTAHELAERALHHHDIRTATWATATGLTAEPIHEGLWRLALSAAMATGQRERICTVATRLHLALDHLGEMEPATLELLNRADRPTAWRRALRHSTC